jgi:hypothetical protein
MLLVRWQKNTQKHNIILNGGTQFLGGISQKRYD